jgi:hypothetical protein
MPGGRLETITNRYYQFLLWSAMGAMVVLCLARHRGVVLIVSALLLTLPVIIFFGLDRYHVVLLPLLVIVSSGGAAVALQRAAEFRNDRRSPRGP